MSRRVKFRAIGVLSVESHLVKFSMISMASGDVVASSQKCLSLIKASANPQHRLATEECVNRLTCTADDRCRGRDEDQDDDAGKDAEHENEDSRRPGHGHVEQDARLLWSAVERVIGETVEEMRKDERPMTTVQSLAIVNEMSTLVAWDAATGLPLHNAVHWTDPRMASPGRTVAAAQWLYRRSGSVLRAGRACRMGTLDAWLMWKLTDGQTYATDVTNASYTGLLDMAALDWDRGEMQARGIPGYAWPTVMRPGGRDGGAPVRVTLAGGGLAGLTVRAVAARPSAALYAQRSVRRRGQMSVTLSLSTAIAVGVYAGLGAPASGGGRGADPWPVVAYREPRTGQVMYGQMAASRAPAVLGWLRDMSLAESVYECVAAYESVGLAAYDSVGLAAYDSVGPAKYESVARRPLPCIVPAPRGLSDAPYCRGDARTAICGIDGSTGREQLAAAAVDAVVHSVADLVECVAWGSLVKRADAVAVDGAFGHHAAVLERLSDVTGCRVIVYRPDMAITGAARLAAAAVDDVFTDGYVKTEYWPNVTVSVAARTAEWLEAVRRSFGWARTDGEPVDDVFAMDSPPRITLRQRVAACFWSVASSVMISIVNAFFSTG